MIIKSKLELCTLAVRPSRLMLLEQSRRYRHDVGGSAVATGGLTALLPPNSSSHCRPEEHNSCAWSSRVRKREVLDKCSSPFCTISMGRVVRVGAVVFSIAFTKEQLKRLQPTLIHTPQA